MLIQKTHFIYPSFSDGGEGGLVEFAAVEVEFEDPELLVLVKLAGIHGLHLKS